MRSNRILYTLASLLCAVFILGMYACSAELDLCSGTHPHKGQLLVKYEWSGTNIEHPDSMVVVAAMTVHREVVASNWSAEAQGGRHYGRFIATTAEDDATYYERNEDEPSRGVVYLTPGEWEISSYTSNEPTIDAARDYIVRAHGKGSLLYFKLEALDELPSEYAHWAERNPSETWVELPYKSSTWIARGKLQVDEYASKSKNYTVSLKPRNVAQRINISFDAKVIDADVEVDRIECAISGIPSAMNVNTMELDINNTHQAIFDARLTTGAGGVIKAKNTLYALGLVNSSSSSATEGSGILSISVFVNYKDNENNPRQRRLDASVNLYELLSDTPSVGNKEEGGVVQLRSNLSLDVRSTLLISKNKLSNDVDALDTWIPGAVVDVVEE